tara:strand:- start:283 stop:726 length:444 start_codon:yes stop_codon:yes gene_type:complete
MGKHTQAIFYLPEELLTKLKLRRIQTGESASKFVARLLRQELVQETKKKSYHDFFKWGNLLKHFFYGDLPASRMDEYNEYLDLMLRAEIITKDPELWRQEERKKFIRMYRVGSDIDQGRYEMVFLLKHLNVKHFMSFFEVNWKVENK